MSRPNNRKDLWIAALIMILRANLFGYAASQEPEANAREPSDKGRFARVSSERYKSPWAS